MTEVIRNQKDTVFRALYSDPKNALELYNGLSGTDYTDETQLKFNTLDNAVYMNIKNDVSFIIQNQTNLYEHQSTWNPNMPLRNLYYIADVLHKYEKNEQSISIYGNSVIMLPNPRFVVFYNGGRDYPEYSEMKLSNSFIGLDGEPALELTVKVYNISEGKNEELKAKCPILSQYATYTETIMKYKETMPLNEAVMRAVDECIMNDVLHKFLLEQKSEVIKMSIYECDQEWEIERLLNQVREETRVELRSEVKEEVRSEIKEEVRSEVKEETRNETKCELVVSLHDKGFGLEEACELVGITMEQYETIRKDGNVKE